MRREKKSQVGMEDDLKWWHITYLKPRRDDRIDQTEEGGSIVREERSKGLEVSSESGFWEFHKEGSLKRTVDINRR